MSSELPCSRIESKTVSRYVTDCPNSGDATYPGSGMSACLGGFWGGCGFGGTRNCELQEVQGYRVEGNA